MTFLTGATSHVHCAPLYADGKTVKIVGPRRIGKTSLLQQVERVVSQWEEVAVVAYLDLQGPRSFALPGWLTHAGRQLGWSTLPTSLTAFAEGVEALLSAGRHPVLCLDEFEALTMRRAEFTRDFFLTLRACGQRGMSIITTSQQPSSALTDLGDPVSPFYNTFPLLRLGPFVAADAADFVTLHRPAALCS